MLTIRNLSKTYPNGVQALKSVTLDIPAMACSACSARTAPASPA
jgi:ABC-type phosphate/phosphonate transport system ATPase subunit